MNRVARLLPWIAAALLVAGCGFGGSSATSALEPAGASGSVLADARSLPDGHPPIPERHLSLPEGHPPLLPEGHPPLPGGPSRCPRSASGPDWQPGDDPVRQPDGDELIST